MTAPPDEMTRLLRLAADGDVDAANRAYRILYDELRRIATAQRNRIGGGETIRTTAVVHEAYLRLAGRTRSEPWQNRRHFLRTAARSMRDLLVDEARRRAAARRGGGRVPVGLDGIAPGHEADLASPVGMDPVDLLSLDAALGRLEAEHPEEYQLAMLRTFAGLRLPEAAETLGLSLRTAERRWRFCRAWLAAALEDG